MKYPFPLIGEKFTEFPNRRKVYLDESFIHHNYARHEDSLYDLMDDDYIEPLTKYKGQRYCMIADIVSQVFNIVNNYIRLTRNVSIK
ncbi:hypothetical protein A3Q56_07501 [Intoshia linei]|uniref:Uncharacterized protein n=1 Tax=Intoshia linei TaxID=1819745 RepID=A0A177AU75_9BILA|nr:hypothetical protein A3Q56_07501 [Intoshia linei]